MKQIKVFLSIMFFILPFVLISLNYIVVDVVSTPFQRRYIINKIEEKYDKEFSYIPSSVKTNYNYDEQKIFFNIKLPQFKIKTIIFYVKDKNKRIMKVQSNNGVIFDNYIDGR